jgi:hypothetical protein
MGWGELLVASHADMMMFSMMSWSRDKQYANSMQICM